MFRKSHSTPLSLGAATALILSALALFLPACSDDDNRSGPDDTAAQPASAKARVKFKGPQRIGNDLAHALSLAHDDLCRELGNYDCLNTHGIALAGVEPYRLRIYEPLPAMQVAAPMAVDRIALSACGERVARDFAAPESAALFGEIAAASAENPSRPSADALRAIAERLYDRLLARSAGSAEIAALIAFYDEVSGDGAGPAEWAQLACFAVATSTEFLFY